MSRLSAARSRVRRWLWLATCAIACTGTPTPEPPDYLPSPSASDFFGGLMPAAVDTSLTPICKISGKAGSIPVGSTLWVVNLDSTDVAPRRLASGAVGGVDLDLPAANGDRVRLVLRTDTQHSLPLDGVCSGLGNTLKFVELAAQELACLEVAPSDLSEEVGATGQKLVSFALTNHCPDLITISSARLRLGDQGFAVASPPASISVGAKSELRVTLDGQSDGLEHGDIVLLDVSSAGASGQYALGIYSHSSSKTGND